jgi:hypothetical protein
MLIKLGWREYNNSKHKRERKKDSFCMYIYISFNLHYYIKKHKEEDNMKLNQKDATEPLHR